MCPEKCDYGKLEKSIAALAEALRALGTVPPRDPDRIRRVVQGGVIQAFEVAYDFCWKAVFRRLREEGDAGVEQMGRKELWRRAGEVQLIDHPESWLQFHSRRNDTSHNYDESLVDGTVLLAGDFLREAKTLLRNLKRDDDA